MLAAVGPGLSLYYIIEASHHLRKEANLCPKLLHKIRSLKHKSSNVKKLVIQLIISFC